MSIYQTWITYSNYLYSDIEAENESRYLYAWLDKHPDVRAVAAAGFGRRSRPIAVKLTQAQLLFFVVVGSVTAITTAIFSSIYSRI